MHVKKPPTFCQCRPGQLLQRSPFLLGTMRALSRLSGRDASCIVLDDSQGLIPAREGVDIAGPIREAGAALKIRDVVVEIDRSLSRLQAGRQACIQRSPSVILSD